MFKVSKYTWGVRIHHATRMYPAVGDWGHEHSIDSKEWQEGKLEKLGPKSFMEPYCCRKFMRFFSLLTVRHTQNNLKLLLGLRSFCLRHDEDLTYHFQSGHLRNQTLDIGHSLFSVEGGLTTGCSVHSHIWRNAQPQSQTSPQNFSFLGKFSLKTQEWNIDNCWHIPIECQLLPGVHVQFNGLHWDVALRGSAFSSWRPTLVLFGDFFSGIM